MSLPITEAKRYKNLALDLAVQLAAKIPTVGKKAKKGAAAKKARDKKSGDKAKKIRDANKKKSRALATISSSAFARRVSRLERAVAADRPSRLRAEAPRAELDLGVGGDRMLGEIHARRMARQGRESRVAGSQPSARARALSDLLLGLPRDQHKAAAKTFAEAYARRTGAR